METIVTSASVSVCANFGIGAVNKKFNDSLCRFLEDRLIQQFKNDDWGLIVCSNPECENIHAIRYFFEADDGVEPDVEAMKEQINILLNKWVQTI